MRAFIPCCFPSRLCFFIVLGVRDLAFYFLMFKRFRGERKIHPSERVGTPAGRRVGCWEGPSGVLGSGQPLLPAPPHPYIPLKPATSTWAKGLPALETPSTTSLLGEQLLTGVTPPPHGCPSQMHHPPEQWPEPLWGWEARRSTVPHPFPLSLFPLHPFSSVGSARRGRTQPL